MYSAFDDLKDFSEPSLGEEVAAAIKEAMAESTRSNAALANGLAAEIGRSNALFSMDLANVMRTALAGNGPGGNPGDGPVRQWEFTIERDENGLIKSFTAVAVPE